MRLVATPKFIEILDDKIFANKLRNLQIFFMPLLHFLWTGYDLYTCYVELYLGWYEVRVGLVEVEGNLMVLQEKFYI